MEPVESIYTWFSPERDVTLLGHKGCLNHAAAKERDERPRLADSVPGTDDDSIG